LVAIVLLLLLPARPAAGQYAGRAACRACHPVEFQSHSTTGHALALRRVAEHPLAKLFPERAGEWAFGAGSQAVTFVSQLDEDHYVEHGLSWYALSKSLAHTPGHRTPVGERYRTFDPSSAILRCFQCHSTGALRLSEGFRIEPYEQGVQCEACHGPAAGHAASRQPVRNPKWMAASEVNLLCGACHRRPASAGDDTDWANPWNARHQPLYLAESACFQESGKLSCVTCHPAHEPLEKASAFYDTRCTECHPKPKHRVMVAGRTCVGCHMPEVTPQPDLRFANHWIGIYAPGKPLRPAR
jgi:hypothetical protein